MRRLNIAQRVVVAATTAVVSHVVAMWVVVDSTAGGGWFGYAPNATLTALPSPRRFSAGVTTAILVAVVATWGAFAVWLFRDGDGAS